MTTPAPTRLLFVCMGNICRSPLAEGVFVHRAAERGVAARFDVDSAGTGAWHEGERADHRMRAAATARGVALESIARPVVETDFTSFDLILCADEENLTHLLAMGAPEETTRLLLDFHEAAPVREVPDPYFGGAEGFERVFDLVDDACIALLDHLLATEPAPRGEE